MSVAFYNSLDVAIDWDAYKPDDSIYITSLKGNRIEPKNFYIWDAVNDANAPFGWDRNSGFQLRIKLASGVEVVSPAQNILRHVDDTLIVVFENNRYVVRAFLWPVAVMNSPMAGSQLGESRYGRPDTVKVDWRMNDVGTMGWTSNYVPRTTASMLVKQAGFSDFTFPLGQDANASSNALTRYQASWTFAHPGAIQLIIQLRGATLWQSSPVSVTVAPSLARSISANFEGARAGSNPPALGFGPSGGTVLVTLTAPHGEIYRNVRFASQLTSGWLNATAVPDPVGPPPATQRWKAQLQVGADFHPATLDLQVQEADGFNDITAHGYPFAIEDVGPPDIVIDEPRQDQPFVTAAPPIMVQVKGNVRDTQTGYRPGSLHYDFGAQAGVPIQVDTSGAFSFTIQATDYGPFSITLMAQDQALPQANQKQVTRQFKVVRALQIETLNDLLSTRAYLGELLRFVRSHMLDGQNVLINSNQLSAAFVQPFGTLAQPGNPVADVVSSDLLLTVRLLRAALGSTAAAGTMSPVISAYRRKAYEALLRGIGASFEELRGLAVMSASTRRGLAERLGLRTANGDELGLLLDPFYEVALSSSGALPAPPPQVSVRSYTRRGVAVRGHIRAHADHSRANNFGPSRTTAELTQPLTRDADRDGIPNYADADDDNDGVLDDADPSQYAPARGDEEVWLQQTFGLPSTADPVASVPSAATVPTLLRAQRSALVQGWQAADADQARLPDIDPDLLDTGDLSAATTATAWRQLLQARRAQLDAKYGALLGAVLPTDALTSVVSADIQLSLSDLAQRDRAGEPVADEIAALHLDMPMFRRLVGYMDLIGSGTRLSGYEREDMAHLLVEIWKRWTLLDAWRRVEEQGMPTQLWPTLAGDGAWVVGGGYRRNFLPWRGAAARRQRLEARMSSRWRAWTDLEDSLDRAVFDAQRASLPSLRDALIGLFNPPVANLDELSERWLVDVETMGVALISPVKQAVSSLQTLINGVHGRWFGAGHPANGWSLKTAPSSTFEDEWAWLETEEQWRAAVMNFLYPENVLYPELRMGAPVFAGFLDRLRAEQPLTEDAAGKLSVAGLADDDLNYHAPVAIALAFQRSGQYSLALDYYSKVYDVSQPMVKDTGNLKGRKRVRLLTDEDDSLPPAPDFDADDFWTTKLSDPHKVATATANGRRVFGNPYTRFTLMQIVRCLLASADAEFASGTIDSMTKARGLYIEAKIALALPELVDHRPTQPGQVYIVNPAVSALRDHVDASLRKLRNGLSILGTPLPPDLTRMDGGGTLSSLVRPTPYRFKVLIERAKQLVSIAQQFEAQYLSAIERNDAELEKALREGFAAQIAAQTVTLREAGVTEAENGQTLALAQQTRSQIERDRYRDWISAGENVYEHQQMDAIHSAADWRQVGNIADTALAAAQAAQTAAGLFDIVQSGGAKVAIAAGMATAVAARGVAQGFAIARETDVQISGLYASQQRRTEEWQLRADIADQDVRIGGAQAALADNRLSIATKELAIANTGSDQAQQMLSFLRNKFTSAAFYDWLTGVLSETYAFFLRLAAATAQQAELQLAFERQEQPRRLVRADYWAAASQSSSADAPDRRGITGSARLLQDLYTLDQQAFSSERRLLNLTQSFSLARLLPVEFETLRRTGQLIFATPAIWFDEGFPGHYMRLVKRVRLSVAALITPTSGIRATLANNGMSRVVTADLGFPTMVIRQDPQSVALTSPLASSGVFELDSQGDLLQPFEGMGVDATWSLEISRAGNSFDFDSLTDVVLSIDYTALSSPDLRDRVVKALPRRYVADRVVSVRRDLPDTWYQLLNGADNPARVLVGMTTRAFPPGMGNLRIEELAISARTADGTPARFDVGLLLPSAAGPLVAAGSLTSVAGIASSRQSGGASWQVAILAAPAIGTDSGSWTLDFANAVGGAADPEPFLAQLRAGTVDDILIALTFSADRPSW